MSDSTTHAPKIRVGFLVFDGFEPIDVWGPVEAFTIARFIGRSYFDLQGAPFEVVLISNEHRPSAGATPAPVAGINGPRVAPDMFRDDALDEKIDLLIVPGGAGVNELLRVEPTFPDEEQQALLDWIRKMDERVDILGSVCTGAAILAAAGVLDGKHATTNQAAFEWVANFGPKVLWNSVERWVDAGHYVTSAGVSAGTDMGFYLVQRLCGRAVAEKAARSAEYDWKRDPGVPISYPPGAVF